MDAKFGLDLFVFQGLIGMTNTGSMCEFGQEEVVAALLQVSSCS
jgi:hypothetical protein